MRDLRRRLLLATSSLVLFSSALVLLPALVLLAGAAGATDSSSFPNGVASGDVTSSGAVLWTRVASGGKVTAEVSADPGFSGKPDFGQTVKPSTDEDLTIHVLAAGLDPGTTYYYRFRQGGETSETGTFRTAPAAAATAPVSFAFSGDSDSLQTFVDGNEFEVLDQIAAEPGLDFWVYLGDTIYSDSSLRPHPATTLDDYRDTYRDNRDKDALPDLLKQLSTYAIWDDHEVQNDYDGQTVDPVRYANGRQAFLEYMPTMEMDLPEDPTCAGDPLFRVYEWGTEVDVFVLDERSCRSADAEMVCATSPQTVDVAPTLPDLGPPGSGVDFRNQFRQLLLSNGVPGPVVDLLLPAVPSPACLNAIADPTRTVLGPVQKQAFKDAIQGSDATYKVIVNEYPIFQFWALPYDRWEGFAAERAELLDFIRNQVSGKVLFVTADTHANFVTDVWVDRIVEGLILGIPPVAPEFVAGPIATFTFQEELASFAAGLGLPPALVIAGFHGFLDLAGVECRNLNKDSFGRVDVATDGSASVELLDLNGQLVRNANPGDLGNMADCRRDL
jgi:alkaline phosphatase D